MSRGNPLFVDSTKFHGDGIQVQIELRGVILRPGERVFALVTDGRGLSEKIALHWDSEGHAVGQIWLKHQQEIEYSFSIENQQKPLYQTHRTRGRATYMILAEWIPDVFATKSTQIPNPSYQPVLKELIAQFDL